MPLCYNKTKQLEAQNFIVGNYIMSKLQQLAQKYLILLFQHTGMLPVCLGLMGTLYGIGFLVGDLHVNTNYSSLELFLSGISWGLLYLIYGIVKLAQPVSNLPSLLKISVSLWGLWAWNYTIFSFIILDTTPIAPAELILITPLLLELIDLVVQLWENKFCRRQKQGNPW